MSRDKCGAADVAGVIKVASILRPKNVKIIGKQNHPNFSLVNALVYVEHRPGHSLGKKSDKHLQCSPWSWLDDFMQPF